MDINASITTELNRMNRSKWLGLIDIVISHFKNYPFDYPDTQGAEAVILALLKSLPRKPDDPDTLTDEYFIDRLSRTDLFTHRAFRHTADVVRYWEPLKERYLDFIQVGETVEYQAEYEYPAPDIIRSWCYYMMRATKE